jgi:hypothetical protein
MPRWKGAFMRATHIFMCETLPREHAHLPGFPISSGMIDWRSYIDLALAYEHLVDPLLGARVSPSSTTSPPHRYITGSSLIRNLILAGVRIWWRMLYGSPGPPGRGMSTVMRLDWLATRKIVIRQLDIDLGDACACGVRGALQVRLNPDC